MESTHNPVIQLMCNDKRTAVGRHCEHAFWGSLRQRRARVVSYYVNTLSEVAMPQLLTKIRSRQEATLASLY